ncbi:hypothetical protein K432DRAFT_310335 [Lepidopterella palustris CBS 459.81]|uniref:Uncharacterized protein n=1 Tax=Lepidopterella palustris CBS 459.81 TaxID=1314670 RepID=A0A8E2J9Q4_9PEZI|nr:hypothetical protein K432DRAFT_310335 [Lepidopterella palustris CBS 459.81]
MFDFSKQDGPSSKCYFTHSILPNYIDPAQPSTKKKPFSTFLSQPFTHTADLILPEEIYELIRKELDGQIGTAHYARVYMSLGAVIARDFFTEYIKKGNIMMLSEGRPGVDNVFSLYGGVLKLELDRPTYERCGLVGKPIEDGGRKHKKARYVVEFNLRSPSMLHGKKGFERLVWACKNVLNNSITWLFHDLQASGDESETPILKHQPILKLASQTPTILPSISTPTLTSASLPTIYPPEASASLLEYLHLISLDSPRIRANDSIDPYLCRYEVPDIGDSGTLVRNLVRVRWHGFISPKLMRDVFLMALKKVGKGNGEGEEWFALHVSAFHGGAYSVLQVGRKDTLVWECV